MTVGDACNNLTSSRGVLHFNTHRLSIECVFTDSIFGGRLIGKFIEDVFTPGDSISIRNAMTHAQSGKPQYCSYYLFGHAMVGLVSFDARYGKFTIYDTEYLSTSPGDIKRQLNDYAKAKESQKIKQSYFRRKDCGAYEDQLIMNHKGELVTATSKVGTIYDIVDDKDHDRIKKALQAAFKKNESTLFSYRGRIGGKYEALIKPPERSSVYEGGKHIIVLHRINTAIAGQHRAIECLKAIKNGIRVIVALNKFL